MRYGNPGDTLTRENRFAQMLAEQDAQAGVPSNLTGGLAHMLRQGLQGFMMGRDEKNMSEADAAFMRGMGAKPWVNPDTGTVAPGTEGGMPGATRELMGLPKSNPYAGRYSKQLMIQDMETKRAAAAAQLEHKRNLERDAAKAKATFANKKALKKLPRPPSGRPSSPIQNYKERARLVMEHGEGSPEVNQFDNYVRAPTTFNLGGTQGVYNPRNPGAPKHIEKTLAPKDEIEHLAKGAGAQASAKQAVEESGKAFDALGKIKTNITNIDDAIAALDKGAETGVVQSFLPSVRSASIELDNIQKRMGLDIIGAVTFGALSKGELDLALNTALPVNLQPVELRKWLVNKKAAQEKLSTYLSDAAIYLGQPGNTRASWAKMHKAGGGGGAAPPPPAAIPPPPPAARKATAIPNDLVPVK